MTSNAGEPASGEAHLIFGKTFTTFWLLIENNKVIKGEGK